MIQNEKVSVYYGSKDAYDFEKQYKRIDENALYFIEGVLYNGYELYSQDYKKVSSYPSIGQKNYIYINTSDSSVAVWNDDTNEWIYLCMPISNEIIDDKNSIATSAVVYKVLQDTKEYTNTYTNEKCNEVSKTLTETINSTVENSIATYNTNLFAEISDRYNSLSDITNAIDKIDTDIESRYTNEEIDNKFSSFETNIDWKEAVDTYSDIAIAYPTPEDGWTVNVKDTDYTYRYNGIEWVAISANAIPLATSAVDGRMSASDKSKLDGITTGAEVNQNAFSNVAIGSTTIAADSKTDTLTLAAGDNVTLTPDAANDKITISATDTVYTHPTTSGNKHIPSGGSSGQILRWSADGTAAWGSDSNTTYSNATTSAAGLMSASDKSKLDGITASADSISFSRSLTSGTKIGTITINGTGTDLYCQTNTDTTYTSLKNPYALTIQGNGTTLTNGTYDGSAAKTVNITPAVIGAAVSSHTHSTLDNGSYTLLLSGSGDKGILQPSGGGAIWIGSSTNPISTIYATNIYEGGTALNSKYATSSHTHNYIPLSGSTAITGALKWNNTNHGIYVSGSYTQIGDLSGNNAGYTQIMNDCQAKKNLSVEGTFSASTMSTSSYLRGKLGGGYILATGSVNTAQIAGNVSGYSYGGLKVTVYGTADGSIASTYGEITGTADNTCNLGQYHTRWMNVYAASGTVSTSDKNLKDNIKPVDEKYKKLLLMLSPVSFTFKDGTSGRTHVGFISQDVEAAMTELGMTSLDFAGFCKDVITEEVTDSNGAVTRVPKLDDNGNVQYIYSLRYTEFIALNTAIIQDLCSEVEDLKKDIADLKETVNSLIK